MTKSENKQALIDRHGLAALIDHLRSQYTVVGPTVREQTLVLDEIESIDDLPAGKTASYDNATFRLGARDDAALFGYVVGMNALKRFLYPPRQQLFTAEMKRKRFEINPHTEESPKYAFLGIRPCDLAALEVHDTVFMRNEYRDDAYERRREHNFFVAVNCTEPGGTCFCTSMGTGPKATKNFDLALTELIDGKDHRFLVEVGSAAGATALEAIEHREAEASDIEQAEGLLNEAAGQMGRSLDASNVKAVLQHNLEDKRYDNVAERCLACTNCTLVCPTCFCMTVEDTTDLSGKQTERRRRWDSCFTLEFSYIHGGSVRPSGKARYRQWITHKLAGWHDQFGMSGCVGCGRCIVWCPVGIDITEEASAIARSSADLGADPHVREEQYATNT